MDSLLIKMTQLTIIIHAAFVKKFETANGEPLVIDGNPVTESDYVKIIDQSPLIARAILEFASDTEGFLDSEKNA